MIRKTRAETQNYRILFRVLPLHGAVLGRRSVRGPKPSRMVSEQKTESAPAASAAPAAAGAAPAAEEPPEPSELMKAYMWSPPLLVGCCSVSRWPP